MANNQKYSTLVILEKQLDGKKTQDEDLSTLVIPKARNMEGTTPMLRDGDDDVGDDDDDGDKMPLKKHGNLAIDFEEVQI